MTGHTPGRTPSVSVVIPAYNHAHFLRRALRSVVAQTHASWEALVVDNYSGDDTDAVVAEFADPRIRLLKIHNHGVIAASRNLGIRESKGEWVAFLDADDCWYPKKLDAVLGFREHHDVVVHDEYRVDLNSSTRVASRYGPYSENFYRDLLIGGNRLSTSATIVRRSFLVEHRLGFSEQREHITVEDYGLWLDLARLNARFRFIPDILGEYVIHETNASGRLALHLRNGETLLRDHVFKVQEFEPSPEALWARVLPRCRVAAIQGHIAERRWRPALQLVARAVIEQPVESVRYATKVVKRRAGGSAGQSVPVSRHHRFLTACHRPLRQAKRIGKAWGVTSNTSLRVLLHHDVAPEDRAMFASQLRWLSKEWNFVSADRFAAMIAGTEPIVGRNLLLTFDDGLASNRDLAEEVLNPMAIPALFFVVSDLVEIADRDEARRFIAEKVCSPPASDLPGHWSNLQWSDLEALLEQGHAVGAHTRTHRRLSEVGSTELLQDEISASADAISLRLGTPIQDFAYTFGDVASFSPEAMDIAKRRFRCVFSGVRGNNIKGVSPFAVRRTAVATQDERLNYHIFSNALVGALLDGAADPFYVRARARLDSWARRT